MTRVRRSTAVVLAVATTFLTTTALSSAGAATPVPAVHSRVVAGHPHTRLHLHITGCGRCSVTLRRAVSGTGHVWTSTTKTIGSDHVVSYRMRSVRTHGLSFELRAPWETDPVEIPNMVTRYAGHPVDTFVSRKAARHGKRAEGCWAGTRLNAVTLDFHVRRVTGENGGGQQTPVPLVYATHSMSSWKPMVKTFKGTIGNQDAFWCTPPPTTTVTFQAAGCNGCTLQLLNGARRAENFWISRRRTVAGETAVFSVPTPLTRGISAVVRAPWEGSPPFTTAVVWRYGGHQVGDAVTLADARTRTKASGCWAGTTDAAVSVSLTVRKVTVQSTTGSPTAGSIAFASVTQPWLDPMFTVKKGLLGVQDVILCQK